MAMMAIGVKAKCSIAVDAGFKLAPNKSIAVNRDLQTSDENINAAEDYTAGWFRFFLSSFA
jgi:NAD(P)H-nitrite reductase large subunit